MLTLVFPGIKVMGGVRRYSELIEKGLKDINYPFNKIEVDKFEISFLGKPYLGIISQKTGLLFKNFQDHPIHALTPEVAPRGNDIVTIHDVIPFLKGLNVMNSFYDRVAFKLMYKNALNSKIILVSTQVGKEQILTNLNVEESRVKVVNHAIDHQKFYPDYENPFPKNNKIHILTMGDFNPRKRYDLIIKGIFNDDKIQLYHIGPTNSWKERYEQIYKLGSKSGNVYFLGELDDNLIRKYLTNADLFIYMSDAEGFGYPPLEAMACGTNVVVNDLAVFREVLSDEAFFSKENDIRKTIDYALNNKKDREHLISFSKKFSVKNEVTKLKEIYEKLI